MLNEYVPYDTRCFNLDTLHSGTFRKPPGIQPGITLYNRAKHFVVSFCFCLFWGFFFCIVFVRSDTSAQSAFVKCLLAELNFLFFCTNVSMPYWIGFSSPVMDSVDVETFVTLEREKKTKQQKKSLWGVKLNIRSTSRHGELAHCLWLYTCKPIELIWFLLLSNLLLWLS